MSKSKRIFLIMLFMLLASPVYTFASKTYTTDDLRVLMGMNRLSEDSSMNEIKGILSSCYKQKQWNELVSALGKVGDTQLKEFKEKEDAWYSSKDILESNFISNKPIKTILSDYVNYQTAASLRAEYTKDSFALSLIDNDDIEAKITYANSLMEAVNDNTNVGVIGNDMDSFTKDKLMITVPFGSSYSINSGKRQTNKVITLSIQKGRKIYSQFNGIVTAVTDNSVTIKTGKSIEMEYSGIKPCVEKKQKIKQYVVIGKTKTKNITVKLKLNTLYFDPLLLYGSRSSQWYEQWGNANPGCTIEEKDYSSLLDKLPETQAAPASESAGTMTDKKGNTTPITIQGDNSYTDTPDTIVIEKEEPGIIENKNQ
jgi:preprotein translocase subunit YajC